VLCGKYEPRGQPEDKRAASRPGGGCSFLAVGILGFIPGITANYGSLGLAGHESEALLLGIFQVSVLHNIVHILFGIAGTLTARTRSGQRPLRAENDKPGKDRNDAVPAPSAVSRDYSNNAPAILQSLCVAEQKAPNEEALKIIN